MVCDSTVNPCNVVPDISTSVKAVDVASSPSVFVVTFFTIKVRSKDAICRNWPAFESAICVAPDRLFKVLAYKRILVEDIVVVFFTRANTLIKSPAANVLAGTSTEPASVFAVVDVIIDPSVVVFGEYNEPVIPAVTVKLPVITAEPENGNAAPPPPFKANEAVRA